MLERRVTSQEVATRAGVSRTTVSFVLNNVTAANISTKTRNRVLKAAEELGYVPNAVAQMLASGQSRTIGLVISESEHFQVDAFIPQLLHGLTSTSHKLGYRVLLETVEDVSKPDAYMHLVTGQRIDGLIVLNTRSDDAQLPELIKRSFPMVLIGFPENTELQDHVHTIEASNLKAAHRATTHLIELGHQRIATITFAPNRNSATQGRRLGYKKALEDAGLHYDETLVIFGNYSAESGYKAMKKLLKHKHLPTALFAGNDTIAIGAMAAIFEHGLRVPEDIAVVGYDDIPTAPYLRPALTTIRTSAALHGERAVDMLSKLMRGEELKSQRMFLETPLVIRKSCGADLKKKSSPRQR